MLVHDVVPREAGIRERGRDVPRQHDRRRARASPRHGASARNPGPAVLAKRHHADRQPATSTGATNPLASMPTPSSAYMAASQRVRRADRRCRRHASRRWRDVTAKTTMQSGRSVRASRTKPMVVASIKPATSPVRSAVEPCAEAAGRRERHSAAAHDGTRRAHSLGPVTRKTSAASQDVSGGFVKKGMEVEVRRDPVTPHAASRARPRRNAPRCRTTPADRAGSTSDAPVTAASPSA